jgi:alkylhydroperoxidase/carboxymuconolactone decarboxylase family protein YurZ
VELSAPKLTQIEGILQMAVYAGFPAALEAVKAVASVFGEPKATNR